MSPKPKIQSTNPLGEDGIVRCHHGEEAARRTSRTSQHPNRDFYCCARTPNDPNRCRFWYWADDPMFKLKNVRSARPSASTSRVEATQSASTPKVGAQKIFSKFHPAPSGPATPSAEGRGVDIEDIETTGRTSPSKSSWIPETPNTRKRLQDIEAGLQARATDAPFNTPIPQRTAGPSVETSSTYAHTSAQANPLSQASTEIDWDEELPPATPTRKKYSFLGLDPSPESTPSALPEPTSVVQPEPSIPTRVSPKKRRLSLIEDSDVVLPGMLLTPPQTTQRPPRAQDENYNTKPEPVTPTRRKGKERSNDSQGGLIMDDEENPFLVSTARRPHQSLDEDAGDVLPQLPPGTSPGPTPSGPPPTPGEQVATHLAGIKSYVDSLEKLQAGQYIQKLERQRKALELGNEVKKKKIAELRTELDDLREKLTRSEASNRAKEAEITHLKARQR